MLAKTVLKEGPGLPLVFLHGFLGAAADWMSVCAKLPPCSCIGLDLPGHGKSPFMETFEIDVPRFHLIGYSMGGRIAMMYAKKCPEQIASLTLLSAHPGLKTEAEKEKRRESDAAWAKNLFELPIDEFLIRWYHQPLFHRFKPDLSMRRKQNREALAASLLHYSLANQPRFEIDRVLVGERDLKFRTLFKNPVVIPQAGHPVHLENPKAVAEELKRRISL
jgi:2-succinyl-6-hydroxy-2,4-cyclohexadiene-1-carboxylate synthase